jgi:hypothetical protein
MMRIVWSAHSSLLASLTLFRSSPARSLSPPQSGTNFELESAYYLMHILIPLKIRNFNSFLASTFLPSSISLLLQPTLTFLIRRTVLLFIESIILVHPRLCASYLENLRNTIRELLCHVHTTGGAAPGGGGNIPARGAASTASLNGAPSNQLNLISRVYSLICYTASTYGSTPPSVGGAHARGESVHRTPHLASPVSRVSPTSPRQGAAANVSETAMNYFNYLRQDLLTISSADDGISVGVASHTHTQNAAAYDPLLSKLSSAQLKLITLTTIAALGSMNASRDPELCKAIVDELTPFLSHADVQFRFFAAEAIRSQSGRLTTQNAAFARWCMLPLLADPDVAVRIAVGLSILGGREAPRGLVQRRVARLTPDDGDDPESSHHNDSTSAGGGAPSPAPMLEPSDSRPSLLSQSTNVSSAATQQQLRKKLDVSSFSLAPSTPLDAGVPAQLIRMDTEEPYYAGDESDLLLASGLTPTLADPLDAASFAPPLIGPPFFRQLRTIVREAIQYFPHDDRFDELMYHMQQLFKIQAVNAATALTLAEVLNFVVTKEEQARPVSEQGEECREE